MNNLLLLIGIACLISCEAKSQSKVVAKITNLRNDDGVCRVCLFRDAATFAGVEQFRNCVVVGVRDKSALAVFADVEPGAYAVFVFHDVNNNNKMDKNILGVPKEGYGASNNKLPFASAPHFEDNKFIVSNNNVISLNIHLRNVF